mgnify:CR=1 FL=1
MIFDLKGSLDGRLTKFNKKWWVKEKGHKKVMKDRNLLEINSHFKQVSMFKIEDKLKSKLNKIVRADSKFLGEH